MMETNFCALKLNHLVFDNISFSRTGFKNNNDVKFQFGFGFDSSDTDNVIVHVRLLAKKKDEYDIRIDTSGYFTCDGDAKQVQSMTRQNAVAIVFPFIRSQLSLLTAQPEMEPIVLPAMNIAALVEESLKAPENQE